MGLIRKPTVFSYWCVDMKLSTRWFPKMFAKNRFQLLLTFFHLVNNKKLVPSGQQVYDPSAKFDPIVHHASHVFRHYYVPHQQPIVDESLISAQNHTSLIQYLPNKHRPLWGIKLWVLCDCPNIVWLFIFTVVHSVLQTQMK